MDLSSPLTKSPQLFIVHTMTLALCPVGAIWDAAPYTVQTRPIYDTHNTE